MLAHCLSYSHALIVSLSRQSATSSQLTDATRSTAPEAERATALAAALSLAQSLPPASAALLAAERGAADAALGLVRRAIGDGISAAAAEGDVGALGAAVARADAVLPAGTVPVGGEQRAALEQLQLRLVRLDGGGGSLFVFG